MNQSYIKSCDRKTLHLRGSKEVRPSTPRTPLVYLVRVLQASQGFSLPLSFSLQVAPSDAAQVDVPAATQEVQQRLWGGLLDPTLAARLQPVSACITRLLPGGAHRTSVAGSSWPPSKRTPICLGSPVKLTFRLSAVWKRADVLTGHQPMSPPSFQYGFDTTDVLHAGTTFCSRCNGSVITNALFNAIRHIMRVSLVCCGPCKLQSEVEIIPSGFQGM